MLVIEGICSMREQWGWHIKRMDNNKWANISNECTPRERKWKKGRPKRRREDIEGKAGKTSTHIVSDQMKWKGQWRPFASS